jgi:hypothetical protein
MGACTVVLDGDAFSPIDGSNAGYMVRGQITMSSSYAAGGDTLAASAFGIGRITKLILSGSIGGATTGYDSSPVYSAGAVVKVQAFVTGTASGQPLNEASGNLSTVIFDAIAYGT